MRAMSRRSQIAMSPEEIDAYLHESHLCRIGTIGPKGDIHLVTMNYGFVGGNVAFWTYKAAQKTKNLERNPTLSVLVDSGYKYSELKGVSMSGTAELRVHKRDNPALYKALDRAKGPLVYRWQREGDRVSDGTPLG